MPPFTHAILNTLYDLTVVPSFSAPGFRLRSQSWSPDALNVDLTGRRYVVTGANAGIGFELSRGLLARGAVVWMVCRDPRKAQEAIQTLESRLALPPNRARLVLADLSLMGDVERAAREVSCEPIDGLINNAGVMLHTRQVTAEGFEKTFATNVLSGFLLTHRLALGGVMREGGRVVHVSSGGMYTQRMDVGDLHFERKKYDGVVAYAQSKRAQVILSRMWAAKLKQAPLEIVSNVMHPGWVETPGVEGSLPRFHRLLGRWLRTPEQGADTALWLAISPEDAARQTGGFFFDRVQRAEHIVPWTRSAEADVQALWAQCEVMCGVKGEERG